MWNERLNEKFTNRLIGFCQKKRVLLVGNSISLFNQPRGEFIDSFDVVVRMGKGYPWPEFKNFLGTKTNVWALSNLRAVHYKEFKNAEYKVMNISQMSIYDEDRNSTSISKVLFHDDFQLYRDYFLMGNIAKTRSLIKAAYGSVQMDRRASQGAITLSYFTNIIRSYSELHLYGFDFFQNKLMYELEGELNEVNSFHMPIPTTKGPNSNPHAGLYNQGHPDKDYILNLRDQGKIILHEMGDLPNTPEQKELFKLMLNRYRKQGVLVEPGVEQSEK